MAQLEKRRETEVLVSGRGVEVRIEFESQAREQIAIPPHNVETINSFVVPDFFASPTDHQLGFDATGNERLSVTLPHQEGQAETAGTYTADKHFGDAELSLQGVEI